MRHDKGYSTRLAVTATAIALATGACVLPRTETTERTLSSRVTGERPGRVGALMLGAESEGSRLVITGARQRTCVQSTVEVVEVTKSTTADVAVPHLHGNSREAGLLLVAAPVTLIASGILTAIVIAADGDDVETVERAGKPERRPCPLAAAGLRVWVELPSGAQVMGDLDREGRFAIPLPAAEPRRGEVIVRTNAVRPARLRYQVARSELSRDEVRHAMSRTSEQIRSCAARAELSGRVVLTVAIADGRASLRATPELDPQFARCADAAFRALELRAVQRPVRVRYPFDLGVAADSRG